MAMSKAWPRVYDENCPALPGPKTQDSTPDSVNLLLIAELISEELGRHHPSQRSSEINVAMSGAWPRVYDGLCPAHSGHKTQDNTSDSVNLLLIAD